MLVPKNLLLIFIAVVAVSWAAIFIKLTGAPPLATAFYRMSFATFFILPLALKKSLPEILKIRGKILIVTLFSGIFLGFHFATWITSLEYTSIPNSVVLVTTQPIFVAVLSHFLLKEKINLTILFAILLALSGSFIISGGDFRVGKANFFGDILALIGAVMAAAYLLCGRVVRQKLSLITYIFMVYFISALVLGVLCIIWGTPLYPYPSKTFLWFILLGLIPTVIGHTLYNWALKYLKAYLVGISILGEPVGATILAYLIFKQIPPTLTYLGAAAIFTGIFLVFWSQKRA
ncbi:MAG: DMT family transporter [candidate division Zixibacteria bacterium]|nr:DMT family transporter [candidate division Zixibacteria bacterium]